MASLRLSFDNPAKRLLHGVGFQVWRLRVRKGSGSNPTVRVDLYEGNTLVSTPVPLTEVSSEVYVDGVWDARTSKTALGLTSKL